MKKRIIVYLLDKLLPETIDDELRVPLLNKANTILTALYGSYMFYGTNTEFDRDLFNITFNIKYHGAVGTMQPSVLLTSFYKKAKEGDKSFMSDPFFRLLRTNKDREVRKLTNIIERYAR